MEQEFFNSEFIRSLPSDKFGALWLITRRFIEGATGGTTPNSDKHKAMLRAVGFLREWLDANGLTGQSQRYDPNSPDQILTEFSSAASLAEQLNRKREIEEIMEQGRAAFRREASGATSLTDSDLERAQHLINDLRDLLTSSALPSSHKQRLLARLEELQREMHKTMSNFDRFWGFVADLGASLRLLGDDAEPIVKRVTELGDVYAKAQAAHLGLPPPAKGQPLLGPPAKQ